MQWRQLQLENVQLLATSSGQFVIRLPESHHLSQILVNGIVVDSPLIDIVKLDLQKADRVLLVGMEKTISTRRSYIEL